MRARSLLLPLVVAAGFLAGCTTAAPNTGASATPTPTDNGVAALPVDQILSQATAAVKATSSFHMKGSVTTQAGKTDLDIVFAGQNAKGTISTLGLTIEIVRIGADVYAKAPDQFWATVVPANLQAQALPVLQGKYAKVPPSLATLVPTLDDLLKPSGTPTKGSASTVNGTPVITLVDTDQSKIYIATTGQPFPIEIENTDGNKIDFTEFGGGATIDAPAASDVVDASKFFSAS